MIQVLGIFPQHIKENVKLQKLSMKHQKKSYQISYMNLTPVENLTPQQVLLQIKALEDKNGKSGNKRSDRRRSGCNRAKLNGTYIKRN